jgi:hypothetical protein
MPKRRTDTVLYFLNTLKTLGMMRGRIFSSGNARRRRRVFAKGSGMMVVAGGEGSLETVDA